VTIIDRAILDAHDKQPFSSILELAQLTCIPIITVHRHLTKSLGFVVRDLRWIPHPLKETCKAQQIALSNPLLRELRSIEDQGWQFSMTLNESWFDLATDHEQICSHPIKHCLEGQSTRSKTGKIW
jgi:hypothetical protein